jgi:predicted nuclease of restriction endonuclease-like (RecB) superfamily
MKQELSVTQSIEQLYQQVQTVIETSRATVYRAANTAMVQAYWNIGRLIVEEEQKGDQKAGYGQQIIEGLSNRLQKQYGKGFDKTNLWNLRKFYGIFPKVDALRQELSWTHYRLLMRVEKEPARQFYLEETIASNWSTRTLERQINSLYYERMLMSGQEDRPAVKQEAEGKKEVMQPGDIIKDPYVLEFLNLPPNYRFL